MDAAVWWFFGGLTLAREGTVIAFCGAVAVLSFYLFCGGGLRRCGAVVGCYLGVLVGWRLCATDGSVKAHRTMPTPAAPSIRAAASTRWCGARRLRWSRAQSGSVLIAPATSSP